MQCIIYLNTVKIVEKQQDLYEILIEMNQTVDIIMKIEIEYTIQLKIKNLFTIKQLLQAN